MKTNKQRWSWTESTNGGRQEEGKTHLLAQSGFGCCYLPRRPWLRPAAGCRNAATPLPAPPDATQKSVPPQTACSLQRQTAGGPRQEPPMEREQHGTGERRFHERTTSTSHLTRRLLPDCWCVCVCSAPVSAAAAASAGWLALHKHTQTQPVHRLPQCRESGSGVTSRCLSGSGPRPRRLAPPSPLSSLLSPLPSHRSHPSTQPSHLSELGQTPDITHH